MNINALNPSLSDNFIAPAVLHGKRCFDVLVSLSLFLVSLPLWPIIAAAIKLESSGPVFFSQLRVGRTRSDRTELFEMIKFRTMVVNAEGRTGAVWASKNDPRVTGVGRFLRKTRLDELPQLINVIRNDMSLVGPRPERPGISRRLNNAIPFYSERTYMVLPGVTGLAQVNQGYDTCLEDVRSKIGYDHAYSLSLAGWISWLRMDMEILWRTFIVMVLGRGQ